MTEKIAFVSWDFIKIVCEKHHSEIVLKEKNHVPYYCCPEEVCNTVIPVYVYENTLQYIVDSINSSKMFVGQTWRKKYLGKTYECRVITWAYGKQIIVSIRYLGG